MRFDAEQHDRPSAIPGYEDWQAYLRQVGRHPAHSSSAQQLADVLGVPAASGSPIVTTDWKMTGDGVTTSQLSWQLGFGPRTRAWLVHPTEGPGPFPGLLALHCHGDSKFGGANRLVKLPRSHSSAEARPNPALRRQGSCDGPGRARLRRPGPRCLCLGKPPVRSGGRHAGRRFCPPFPPPIGQLSGLVLAGRSCVHPRNAVRSCSLPTGGVDRTGIRIAVKLMRETVFSSTV